MGRPTRHLPPLVLGLPKQLAHFRGCWGHFDTKVVRGQLIARGDVQPTPISSRYRVRVEYRLGEPPEVWVESPELRQRSPEEQIPHTYSGPRPCLYLGKAREWTPAMPIATTVMPWLLTWLFFYEIWHATGTWYGGGVEHSAPERPR